MRWSACYTAFLFMFLTAHTVVFFKMVYTDDVGPPGSPVVVVPQGGRRNQFALRILIHNNFIKATQLPQNCP